MKLYQTRLAIVMAFATILAGCHIKAPVTGLRAIYPPVLYDAMGEGIPPNGRPEVSFVKIDSLQPTFRWKAFESKPNDQLHDPPLENIRYDLKIWQVDAGLPAALIYEREGLPATEHRLEKQLLPATRYCWTVRARFEINGQIRVSGWSFSDWPWPPVYATEYGAWTPRRTEQIPPANYYRFETP